MSDEIIKLTKYSHGAGCGCKIDPHTLAEILSHNSSTKEFKEMLVGNAGNEDAAVYQITETDALVATTDFFTPIVNDPFTFGQATAANALSDVYAMGGEPILALAILGWPIGKIPISAAKQVLEGARSICSLANIPLAGGHSIDTPEPIFGLSVNGRVAIKNLKRNSKAEEGDVLLLTKPIGIGVFSTAEKRELLEENDREILYQQLTKLNNIGAELGKLESVHALTDVTGFGLAGHLIEMAENSNLSAVIEYHKIPKLKGVEKYLSKNSIPDATYRNWKSYSEKIELGSSINTLEAFQLLPDPQTNGGLLIAVDSKKLAEVQLLLEKKGYSDFIQPFGNFIKKVEKQILVK